MALASEVQVGDVLARGSVAELKVIEVASDFLTCLLISAGAVTQDRITLSAGALRDFSVLKDSRTATAERAGAGRALTLVVDDGSDVEDSVG